MFLLTIVDSGYCNFQAFLSPCVEILSFDFLIFDWVLFHDLVSVVGVIDPLEQLDRLHSVTGVLVNN